MVAGDWLVDMTLETATLHLRARSLRCPPAAVRLACRPHPWPRLSSEIKSPGHHARSEFVVAGALLASLCCVPAPGA